MNKKYVLVLIITIALACAIIYPGFAQLGVTIYPSTPQAIDYGQFIVFTSTVQKGSGNYTYQWNLNGKNVTGATGSSWNLTQTYYSMGSNSVCLYVTDIGVKPDTGVKSTATSATVNPALSVKIGPSTATKDVGQPLNFSATVTNGTRPYKAIWWYLNNTQEQAGNNTLWTFTPASKGQYYVTCAVQDSSTANPNPMVYSNTAWVTVNPQTVVTISSSFVMDMGQSKVFTAYAQAGTPPYSYQWCLNNAAVSGATTSSWTFTPSSSGSYSVYVNVTDSVGFRAKSNVATVTVSAVPSVSTSPYNLTWEINRTYTFTESVTGGTSPYTYYWGYGQSISQAYINMGNNGPTTSNTWTFNFTSLGNWIVICNVFDSAKGTPILGPWGSTAYVDIVPYPLLHLSANITVPNLAFIINGTSYPGPVVYQPFPPGTYTISVSPTTYLIHSGRYYIEYVFVGWSNSTSPGTIISTSSTITITLNKDTGLIADYVIYTNFQPV